MAKKVILWSRVILCILMGVCFALNTYAALSPYWSKPEDGSNIEVRQPNSIFLKKNYQCYHCHLIINIFISIVMNQ